MFVPLIRRRFRQPESPRNVHPGRAAPPRLGDQNPLYYVGSLPPGRHQRQRAERVAVIEVRPEVRRELIRRQYERLYRLPCPSARHYPNPFRGAPSVTGTATYRTHRGSV